MNVSPQNVLESWLVIEFLSSANSLDRSNCFSLTADHYAGELKPHHKGIKVLLGIFDKSKVQERLATLFNDQNFREPAAGTGYIAELTLDQHGVLVADSVAISTLPWAIRQLELKTELGNWNQRFDAFKKKLADELGDFFRTHQGSNLIEQAQRANRLLVEYFDWETVCRDEICFKPLKKNTEEEEPTLLNSFFATDLSRLLSLNPDYAFGPALHHYLSRQPTKPRSDTRRSVTVIQQLTAADQLPTGSWPSPNTLSLMQQVAVNASLHELSEKVGIFSVNGPPGTGKTTLLKDVFAAIIVNRAKKLATYTSPADAFTSTGEKIRISANYNPVWYQLQSDLADDAIIVASSNNTAIENLTKEIPIPEKDFLTAYGAYPDTVYFPAIGQLMMENPAAWNALALALGKGENKARFVTNWYGTTNPASGEKEGIQSLIKQTDYTRADWQRATADFEKALKTFDEIKQKAVQAGQTVDDPRLNELLTANQFNLSQTQHSLKRATVMLRDAVTAGQTLLSENALQFQLLQAQKPAFWNFWFNLKAARIYRHEATAIAAERQSLQSRLSQLHSQQADNQQKADLLANLIQIRTEYGAATPDPAYWHSVFIERPSDAQEKAPWLTKPVKEASFAVFFAALRVQQVFVGLAQKPLLANLNILVNHFSGKATLTNAALTAVWNTLFLLTPVVSTTFAAAGRLFGGLGREAFGWLFIDEAGQAVPQAAAGTIWRCKRAVIIGDPLQIEPVVGLPETVFEYIRTRRAISSDWISSFESVQTFGDAANYLGTTLPSGQWIGSPLTVHRRCLEPMFSIANQIAYDNIMQNANRENQPEDWGIGVSRFVQITGQCSVKQWVPAQGQAALDLIRHYKKDVTGKGKPFSLFVITPFRVVAEKFRQLLPDELKEDMKGKVGTVHTFQGKEANIVIFLIGCDATRKPALRWADDKPNLLNVALTRAKQQFIAIGDRNLLSDTNHFSIMLTELDDYERGNAGPAQSLLPS